MDNTNFYSNLGASALGNILLLIVVGISWVCKNKCKHSKSKCDMGCCQFSAQEDSIETMKKRKTESKENLLLLLKELKVIVPDSPKIVNDINLNAPRSKDELYHI